MPKTAIKDAFKKLVEPEPACWVYKASEHRSHSYMDVTYKCGCTVRSYSEADWTCSKHFTQGVKRIVRVTEYD